MCMRLFKKCLVLLLAVCLSVCCFVGCGDRSGPVDPPPGPGPVDPGDDIDPPEPPVPGKINIRVGITSDTSERDMMKAVIAAYTAKHSDVNISIVQIAGNYSSQIVNLASSGELPDVFMNYDTLVGYLAKSKVSLDLTSYLDQYEINPADFYPSMYALGKVNDQLHMLPREYAHAVVYYNKTLMRDAGVDMSVIKNGWTWEQFESVAQKLVKKRGSIITQYGADLQLNWPTTVLSYVYGKGGTLFSTDKKTCTIDNANTQQAYAALKENVDGGVYTNVFKAGMSTFISGKVGMYFSVRTQANSIHKTYGSEWDVVSFPTMSGASQYVGSGTTGYSVSTMSENRDTAFDFLMFMMSEEGMNVIAETGLVIPSRISMNNESAVWRNYPRKNINQDAFVYMPERDLAPLSSFIENPTRTPQVTDALNLATESLLQSLSGYAKHKNDINMAMAG